MVFWVMLKHVYMWKRISEKERTASTWDWTGGISGGWFNSSPSDRQGYSAHGTPTRNQYFPHISYEASKNPKKYVYEVLMLSIRKNSVKNSQFGDGSYKKPLLEHETFVVQKSKMAAQI
jgi:hypothetical protein